MTEIPNPAPATNGSRLKAVVPRAAGTTFGGACAVLIILWYHAKGIDFPAGGESALAIVISTITGVAAEIIAAILVKLGVNP